VTGFGVAGEGSFFSAGQKSGFRGHRFDSHLIFDFGCALGVQTADSAASKEIAAQRNHRDEEQREPLFGFDNDVHGGAHALGARSFLLRNRFGFGPYTDQKKHRRGPFLRNSRLLDNQRECSTRPSAKNEYDGDGPKDRN
jgi:hypothetical protein